MNAVEFGSGIILCCWVVCFLVQGFGLRDRALTTVLWDLGFQVQFLRVKVLGFGGLEHPHHSKFQNKDTNMGAFQCT